MVTGIQVHLSTSANNPESPTQRRNIWVWVLPTLKIKPGSVLTCAPSPTEWEVEWVGTLTDLVVGIAPWKVIR